MTGGILLGFEDVGCVRGGRRLFQNLGFSLSAGDALLLTGPNGIGKSSLIRIAAGLLDAAEGRVVRAGPAALLAHELALDPDRSLGAALRFWARMDGAVDAAVGPALQAVALGDLEGVPARFLSSGQKRRAGLARVIASGAPLWLLDEPGVGLDAASLELLAGAIARHRAAGGAVVAATHMELGLGVALRIDLGMAG